MKNDYNDFVSTLPATGYNSAGKLLWQPRWIEDAFVFGFYFFGCVSSTYDGYYKSTPQISTSYLGTEFRFSVLQRTLNGTSFHINNGDTYHSFRAPISGSYTLLSSQVGLGAVLETSGSTHTYDWKWIETSLGGVRAGDPVSVKKGWPGTLSNGFCNFYYYVDGYLSLYTPVFEIVPFTPDTTINNTYNINTRVNNFQGDYYDNVTNNYYNNTTIINETTNNYYDMTTNNYYTMSNWSYDYQSRTYFVTLEDGTTITVQFGDDCLTITNNNVENSYQYVINNNTPSPNPETSSTCKHNWTETIDVEPTCLEDGHANFTCSLCGETYEQILSAKGHNWTVKEHVNTVYGENGVIVTQGHTLYECSACGEQWYTETAAPPPDLSGGTNILAWLQSFQTWLGAQLELVIDKIQVTINNTETNIENVTNVVIEKTNNAYNVFYVTTEDGDEKPIGEVAGDTLSASGKLLNFLYKLCFEGALSKVDDSISAMDGFYFDNGAGLEGNVWD